MIQQLTNLMFWGNNILDYLISTLIFFIGFLVVKIIKLLMILL